MTSDVIWNSRNQYSTMRNTTQFPAKPLPRGLPEQAVPVSSARSRTRLSLKRASRRLILSSSNFSFRLSSPPPTSSFSPFPRQSTHQHSIQRPGLFQRTMTRKCSKRLKKGEMFSTPRRYHSGSCPLWIVPNSSAHSST